MTRPILSRPASSDLVKTIATPLNGCLRVLEIGNNSNGSRRSCHLHRVIFGLQTLGCCNYILHEHTSHKLDFVNTTVANHGQNVRRSFPRVQCELRTIVKDDGIYVCVFKIISHFQKLQLIVKHAEICAKL